MFDGVIAPHAVEHANNCCFLAGSHYNVYANYQTHDVRELLDVIVPRLCNTRGIPFGYASLYFGNVKGFTKRFFSHRVDHGCP